MEQTLIEVDGLGLAAPQVGQNLRMCLAKIGSRIIPLINPRVTWKSSEENTAEEGCLSLPGINVRVSRAQHIIVQFLDTKGTVQERKLSNLAARIVQHELDHLDGVLIIDYR